MGEAPELNLQAYFEDIEKRPITLYHSKLITYTAFVIIYRLRWIYVEFVIMKYHPIRVN
jgi:hypothetical protein